MNALLIYNYFVFERGLHFLERSCRTSCADGQNSAGSPLEFNVLTCRQNLSLLVLTGWISMMVAYNGSYTYFFHIPYQDK